MPCALRESTRSSHGLTSLSIASSSLFTTPLSLSLVGLRDTCCFWRSERRDERSLLCSSRTFEPRCLVYCYGRMNRWDFHDEGHACSSLCVRPSSQVLCWHALQLVCYVMFEHDARKKKSSTPLFAKRGHFKHLLPIQTHLSPFAKAIHVDSLIPSRESSVRQSREHDERGHDVSSTISVGGGAILIIMCPRRTSDSRSLLLLPCTGWRTTTGESNVVEEIYAFHLVDRAGVKTGGIRAVLARRTFLWRGGSKQRRTTSRNSSRDAT